jgi:hypothetical protein
MSIVALLSCGTDQPTIDDCQRNFEACSATSPASISCQTEHDRCWCASPDAPASDKAAFRCPGYVDCSAEFERCQADVATCQPIDCRLMSNWADPRCEDSFETIVCRTAGQCRDDFDRCEKPES